MIRAACLQMTVLSEPRAQQQHIRQAVEQAARNGNQLLILPELHQTPYFCQVEDPRYYDWAEPIPGPTSSFYGTLAKEFQVVLVTSLFERRAPGIYHNTAVVFETDGRIAGLYRKMHIPDDPGYYEKYYFTPGDLGFEPIDTSVGRLGVLVCWDQWFPEAARLMALRGAEYLIYPTAIGWDVPPESADPSLRLKQRESWELIQRSHAIANGLPCLVCNRMGFEPHPQHPQQGTEFWGHSFIAGPQGELLSVAQDDSSDSISLVEASINKLQTEEVRRAWPFLRDRRIEHYQDLLSIYAD